MTDLQLLSEALAIASCVAALIGCFVLNRRVQRLASTERGIGKAVSEMSRSVDQFEKLLVAAEGSTREASTILDGQLAQARQLAARLETLEGAAPRAAAPRTPTADPLADVVPKGAALAAPPRPTAAGGMAANGSAQERLADLARQRAMVANAAAGLSRGARP